MAKKDNFKKIKWRVTGTDQWTSNVERGRQAVIQFTAPGTYTLSITGDGAPDDADYATRGNAKDAFRLFLLDKSE